jgi:hypothetical protein
VVCELIASVKLVEVALDEQLLCPYRVLPRAGPYFGPYVSVAP